jgi:phenylacetate-CoA ligase
VEAKLGVPVDQYPAIAKKVANHVKAMVGVTCRAVVLTPGEVPRSQGKAVRVRDLRPKVA